MIDLLIEPFETGFGQRALIEVVVLGVICGPLGVWVLALRHAYAAESLAHAMLPGLVLAALLGLPLLLGAVGGMLLGAVLVALAARERRIGGDLSVAIVVTALTGAGALLALSPQTPPRLADLLFGDLLGVTDVDLLAGGVLAVLGAGALAIAHRALALTAFDPGSARALGTRAASVELFMLVLLGLAAVVVVRGLGSLLAVALLLAPSASALRLAGRLPVALVLAAALAVGTGVVGLYVSHFLGVATGASVALVAVTLFGLSLVRGTSGGASLGGPVEALGEVR